MKNKAIVSILLLLVLFLTGCSKYEESDFLGKTSAQIMEQYGAFDCINMPADADGLYRNTGCGYTVAPSRKGFLDAEPERLFFIRFDENAIAVSCHEGYRPGG